MSLTVFDPEPVYTAGNSAVYLVPAIADITAPTVAEINAGIKVDCAIEGFEPSADVSRGTRKKLCDTVAAETLGATKFSISDIGFAVGDPQAASNPLLTKVTAGSVQYIVVRPGLAHATAPAAAQKVWVFKTRVASMIPGAINSDDGNEFTFVASFAVEAAEFAAAIAA